MEAQNIDTLTRLSPEAAFLFAALGMLRPMGFLFGFSAFSFGMGLSVTVRAASAIAISLPTTLLHLETMATIAAEADLFTLVVLLPKEFLLGYGYGIVAILPFITLQYAGAISDAYRGESNSGINDPIGGELSTFGLLCFVIGLFVFFDSGGLWLLIEDLYRSYELWPVDRTLPALGPGGWLMAARLTGGMLRDALIVAAPLLILMLAIDFCLAIAARFAQKFQPWDNSFILKNLVALASLPLLVLYIERMSSERTGVGREALSILRTLLP